MCSRTSTASAACAVVTAPARGAGPRPTPPSRATRSRPGASGSAAAEGGGRSMTARVRATLMWLFFALAVLPVAPAAAQLTQAPGPDSAATKADVPIYRPEQDKLLGRVSIPDGKLAVLVQPEGRTWREFRTFWLPWVVAALSLGPTAL